MGQSRCALCSALAAGLLLAKGTGVALALSQYDWPAVSELDPMPAITNTQHPDYPGFPDPLRLFDFENTSVNGAPVETAQQWVNERRPQIADMIQHYVYGFVPAAPTNLTSTVLSEDSDAFGDGTTTRRVVRLDYGPAGTKPATVNLYLPNHVTTPAAVVVSLNRDGNAAIEPGGSRADRWHLGNTIARGYAVATAHTSDFASDNNSFPNAIIDPYAADGFEGDWKAIGAWAYGISRIVDYLDTDAAINPDWTIATGFSRRAKAAMFAAAMDERIDMVAPHQSGAVGAHPTRSGWGNGTGYRNQFTHWFLDEFNTLSRSDPDEHDQLPFDQHFLVAMAAPRLVYLSEGQAFGANEAGVQAVVDGAAPAWELLGRDPSENLVLAWDPEASDSNHLFTLDHWNGILDYADVALIPEPASLALLAAGGLLLLRRRRTS